jgi:hypothetical protein
MVTGIYRNDDTDTRRELFYNIQEMPPHVRLRFVEWAALEYNAQMRGRRAVQCGDVLVKARDTTGGDCREAYQDVCMLLVQGLDLDVLMREAARVCKACKK